MHGRVASSANSLLVAAVSVLTVACVSTTPEKISASLRDYKVARAHKAFAIARDASGAAAWGWAFGEADINDAKSKALTNCRAQLPVYAIQSDCVLYAINDLIVYIPPTTAATAPPIPSPSSRVIKSGGTCFAIRPDGVLLMANHVIRDADSITAVLPDGTALPVTIEAVSEAVDLAVLRIAHSTPHYLSLAAASAVKTGERVFTMGFPAPELLGPEPKYSEGSVSSMSGPNREASLLQITIPVQPGNSGGPVVNMSGDVVGVVISTAAALPFLRTTGLLPQNVNWAVSAEFARPLFVAPGSPNPDTQLQSVERVRQALCYVEATSRE